MPTADSVKSKLQSLLALINQTTNEQDTTLTIAIDRLVSEYTTGQTSKIVIDTNNLHNIEADVADNYYDNGKLVAYSGWSATELIPIEKGSIYALSTSIGNNINATYVPLFNEDKTFSENIGGAIGFPAKNFYILFKAPQTGYIAFSAMTSCINNLSIYRCTGEIVIGE